MEIGQEWFKLYSGIIWDASVRNLSATHKWLYVTILCLLNEEGYDDNSTGILRRTLPAAASNPSHLCVAAGSDVRTTRIGLEKLQENSLIIVKGNSEIVSPNWYKFQKDRKKGVGEKNPKTGRHKEVDIDTTKEIDIDTVIGIWQSLPNLQQPQKITPEDNNAVAFRLKEGATTGEVESVLTWYNAQLGNPRTFWGGKNEDGKPIKFNLRRVMRGKLSDRLTYVYEHFLAQAKGYKPPKPKEPEGEWHPCAKGRKVYAGGRECERLAKWLADPKTKYPCDGCDDLLPAI